MSTNSFKVKNSLSLAPIDLTTLVSPENGELASDINDSNKIKFYDSGSASWKEVPSSALITDHISDAADAHAGTAITNTPSGNLTATTVQAALNELQTDVDTRAAGAASSTDNALARFDLTTGKILQNSVGILSDAGILTGLTGLTSSGTISSTGTLSAASVFAETPSGDGATTGANATITYLSPIIRLTNSSLTSVDMLTSPVAGANVTLINQTGNSITINNDTGASAANRIKTGTGAPITVKDEASIQLKYDSTESRWMVIGGTGSGSGAGGINYIGNSDFESGTTGWATYADAAAATPADGTGGTATSTLTASASSPLRGLKSGLFSKPASNEQGEGFSYDFTIDAADQAQVLRISFDYETSANYVDGDMRVYVYDVTNAVLIEVLDRDIYANAFGKYVGTFQASSNSTSYRLICHVASVSALAYTLKVDNIITGPQTLIKGPIVSDWIAFTPTGGFSGANVAWAGRYRRVGDSAEFEVQIDFTGAPTGTTLSMDLPAGLSIDTAKISSASANDQLLGLSNLIDNDTAANRTMGGISVGSSTTIRFRSQSGSVTNTSPFTWATGDQAWANFKVPILGWSSNTVLSEDAGNRQIFTLANITGGQTITSTAVTKVTFNTAPSDLTSSFNTSTNEFTAPESGVYSIAANLSLASLTVDENYSMFISAGGQTVMADTHSSPTTSGTWHCAKNVYLTKGDIVLVNVQSTADTSYTVSATTSRSWLTISKFASPQTIGMGDTVAASYVSNSGAAISGAAIYVYETVRLDTHNAYNTSTGVYTAPQSGYYSISCSLRTAAVTLTGTQYLSLIIRLNGSSRQRQAMFGPGASTQIPASASCVLYLSKGDTVDVQASSSVATTASATSTADNNFSIVKVG